MIIAAMSDSHDHRRSLENAVAMAKGEGAQVIFHLGDLISPFMLRCFREFTGRIYLVIGNNDGDRLTLARAIPQECPQVREFAEHITVEAEGVRISATHYPHYARALAASGDYDMVFYGHSHEFSERRLGDTLLLNPGELMGLQEDRSFCLVDTDSRQVRRLYL